MKNLQFLLRDIQFLHDMSRVESFPIDDSEEEEALIAILTRDLQTKVAKLATITHQGVKLSSDVETRMDRDVSAAVAAIAEETIGVPKAAIVVAARQELVAVNELFEELGCSSSRSKFGTVPGTVYSLPTKDNKQISIAVLAASGQRVDPMKSLILGLANLEEINFEVILMVGMMGGFPDKSELLEVILPDHIYDGRHFSVETSGYASEPGAAPRTSSVILDVAANLPEIRYANRPVRVRTHKTTITVAGKWDSLSDSLVEAIRAVDLENAVGVEQEGSAISEVRGELERAKRTVPIGMIKGVADYCSIGESLDPKEISKVLKEAGIDTSGPLRLDPSGKEFKPVLQKVATKRAAMVAIEIIRDCIS